MRQNLVAISSDFLTAFAALPRQIQGKVAELINKLRNNPNLPGLNYEKIHHASDDKICSVRIDDTYRGIVVRQKESGVYILLWVDHHDKAYEWARRKKCEINPRTGSVQVFDIQEVETTHQPIAEKLGLFAYATDNELLALGVPDDQIKFVRRLMSSDDFYHAKSSLPEDAYEGLEWIANGFSPQEVVKLLAPEKEEIPQDNDFETALQNLRSQRSFVVVEGEEDLRRIMAEPLERWRVFLHPTQRKVVQKQFSGPARVLGGAGTGKTVVAMHRAKWLAGQLPGLFNSGDKVLFTTFTTNLAGDIKDNLRKICTVEEHKRIEVINLDAWVAQFLREQGYSYSIAYSDILAQLWEEAISLSGEDLEFTSEFYAEEWSKVVTAQEAFTVERYMKASRLGRGIRLDRKKRLQVWNVFTEYMNLMKEKQIRDVDTAMYECRMILEKTIEAPRYASVIVDEGQDLGMNAFRLLRALAGPEHPNDLFIVGDAHQRIYKKKAVLSKCDINIRGRSSYLKINYRTTEEIRKYAFSLLKGTSFDDLDEDYDHGRVCQSLTHGEVPQPKNFKDATEEFEFIMARLKQLIEDGVNPKNICLVARTHRLLDDYIAQLTRAGIKTYEIKRSKLDDRTFDGVRVATMHRVKGLEFQYVFVVAVNNRVVPFPVAINTTDPVAEVEAITAEKCLLYVALTRAQKLAYITSYGTPSEFLVVKE
jgi:superfamily I DNA/RNA helicase/mRNA-degrading endonuclease RelE of RelBE toxin-antitoxin system